MALTAKEMVDAARANVDVIEPADVGENFVLDVREPGELEKAGAIEGALNVPRGLLEWQADLSTEGGAGALKERGRAGDTVCVLCAAGGRAILAADTLNRMGYRAVYIRGGIGGWKEAGLPTQ
jgi:rhodanese-related sulfurtransferase